MVILIFIILLFTLTIINVCIKNYRFRIFTIIIFLTVGIISYFGIITSSRVAILEKKETSEISEEWVEGSVNTRIIMQKWLSLAKVTFISSLILSLMAEYKLKDESKKDAAHTQHTEL